MNASETITNSFEEMKRKVDEINKLKKTLDTMTLDSRPDVQIIHQQLGNLNREILYATQDKELKEKLFNDATIHLKNLMKTQENLTQHLELITKAHKENKEKTLQTLMKKLNSN
tara:strand:+ start:193 stop:534 length:342 start_codon:yes stop_codon:yes gene_type:complete